MLSAKWCPQHSIRGCPRVSVSVRECPRVSTNFCSRNTVCQIQVIKLISWTISREMLSAKWCPQNTVHECPRVSVGVCECPRNCDHEILSAKLQNILQVTSWLVEIFQAKCCLQIDVCKILSASVRGCPWVSRECPRNYVHKILSAKLQIFCKWQVELSWTISREMLSAKWCPQNTVHECPRVSMGVRECPWVSAKFCSRNTVCQIANILQVTSWLVELFQAKCCLQNDVRKILSVSVRECPWVSASVREILFTKYCLPNCKYSSSDKLIIWTISREMLSAKWCPQNTVHECPQVSVGVRECPLNFVHEILSAKLQIFFKWQVD